MTERRNISEQPPTDDDLINIEVEMALLERRIIGDSGARVIASQWHSGQSSYLYSFASTGYIGERLLDEIRREIQTAAEQGLSDSVVHLIALEQYVEGREDTEGPANWSQLWLGKGPDEDTDRCPACSAHFSTYHADGCPLDRDEEVGDE